jgi:transcription elongation GreA/GreB family factor
MVGSKFHSALVKKAEVIGAVIERLRADMELYQKAALAARLEATHEQSKAENKYDTRGLEASYLARGQSRQLAELEQAIVQFQKLGVTDWPDERGIDLGALVVLEAGKEKNFYLVGPRAGGTEVEVEGIEIMVITPESPLGAGLIGRKQGEKCVIEIGGRKQNYKIARVS